MIKRYTNNRDKRKRRIRIKIVGKATRPRVSVFRSNKYIYAQLIDDTAGKTLISVSNQKDTSTLVPTQKAKEIGKLLAQAAKKAKITSVVFDRSGYKYHGRIKALAEGAREGGLQF